MSVNQLNGAFNAAQARAIEKYVAQFVADVLKSYEAGPIENGKAVRVEAKPAKAAKVMLEDVVSSPDKSTKSIGEG
jgi:hypothetical protein